MMRWLLLAVLVVAISAAAAWISLTPPMDEAGQSGVPFPVLNRREVSGPPPTLVLEADPTYEFGVMAQQLKGRHEWVIRNSGPGELKLTGTMPGCSCTVIDPRPNQDVVVAPNASYTVQVEWETRTYSGPYKKDARILTNDPRWPEITFVVRGEVHPAVVLDPADGIIDARNVGNDRPHEFFALVHSPDRPRMAITAVRTSRPDLLDVDYRPLNEQERSALKAQGGGYRLRIVVKPTRKLGPFREEVVVQTDHPQRSEVRLTVAGKVVGPISVTPPEGIRLGNVPGDKGQEAQATLWVRGQDTTHFIVAKVPKHLKVAVAPVRDQPPRSQAAGRAYRLIVTVEPGTLPGVIDDAIVLKTDHPLAGELEVPVDIRILGGAG